MATGERRAPEPDQREQRERNRVTDRICRLARGPVHRRLPAWHTEGANQIRTRKKSLMKTYDTPAPADSFARSRICFEFLVEDLASGRAQEMTHDLIAA